MSSTSRKYGFGVDNVLQFKVVLANGSFVTADACTNQDLFWALRGGGGGTFGVVTSVHYKIHEFKNEVIQVVDLSINANDLNRALPAIISFADFFFEKTPDLDNRWGGYWSFTFFNFYFVGSLEDAESTFLDDVQAWKSTLSSSGSHDLVTIEVTQYDSYYNARNMGSSKPVTDLTGQDNFIISNRIISKDWVKNNRAKAIEYFGKTSELGGLFNYSAFKKFGPAPKFGHFWRFSE